MTLLSKLSEWRAVCEGATPGIWYVEDYRESGDWRSTGLIWAKEDDDSFMIGTNICAMDCRKLHAGSPPEKIAEFEANATFIATSRTALPIAIEALEIAIAELEIIAEEPGYAKGKGPWSSRQARECLAALNELFGDK